MNIDKYIGLPYLENGRDWTGVDCWGLARLYYKEELGLDLPDYSEFYSGGSDPRLENLVLDQKALWIKTTSPQPNDLCVFSILGSPVHVGVYLGNNTFLHCREGQDSVVESLTNIKWANRLEGYYSYNPEQALIAVNGSPHPLRLAVVYEHAYPGTTLEYVAANIYNKYSISATLRSRMVVAVDGEVIPQEHWPTYQLREGQQVSYKIIAQGRTATRLLLTVAVLVAAYFTYGATLELVPASMGAPTVGLKVAAAVAAATVQVAGMALVNAIAPIRMPNAGQDPGQPNQLNLFNGSSNQINRFGAIPVILGKVRYTGLLGATPYTKTLTDTNILNLLIVWGFGPLQIDENDICVGANNLNTAFYDSDTSKGLPRPYTLIGSFNEDSTQTTEFNKRYPQDVEQIYSSQGELVNNQQEGTNVWREVTFLQQATGIDIALTFPEGLRAIKTTGDGAGKIVETTATVEIQVAKVTDSFGSTPQYQAGTVSSNPNAPTTAVAFKKSLRGASISSGPDWEPKTVDLYKWYVICLTPSGEIVEIAGTPTDNQTQEPSQAIKDILTENSLGSLINAQQDFSRLPTIPTNYIKLYSLCFFGNQGLVDTINHLASLGGQGYNGFALTTTAVTVDNMGTLEPTGEVVVTVNGGTYYPQAVPVNGQVTPETHFATRQNSMTETGTGATATPVLNLYSGWSDFLKQNSVWIGSNNTIDIQGTFTIPAEPPERDVYFEAAVDDEAKIYVDGVLVFDLPKQSWRTSATGKLLLTAGSHTVRIIATNSEGGNAGVAFKITSKQGTSDAPLRALGTFITFGSNDIYSKRKDPFNHVYSLRGLERAVYKLRVRRVDNDDPESLQDYRKYHKVALLNATSYDNVAPLQKLPRGNLCRTVIQVQSSNKVNGSVDGINALLQTLTYDWDSVNNKWEPFKATNNPASLFLYILTHPANAYRVAKLESNTFIADVAQKVDLAKIQEWHQFCSTPNTQTGKPVLSYNSVLTGTTSVMDALRDVCAAGMASPIFIDGKWSVVIDKPRAYAVQHFTPHNSWGFEATKALPKIPDAFRVTIQDESNAYQTKELIIYNYGKNASNAEVFEELQLPGITNAAQATFFAKWHLAQLKLRPETYILNTDFEYLVCNRGDMVRVTHDVPLWGTGSGRIKAITGNQLVLTESVYLETTKEYRLLIRTNTGASTIKTVQTVPSNNYYDTVTCTTPIVVADNLEVDNLFIIGEVSKESQELVVLAVEPSSNLTARITLTDYSSEIYSLNLTSEFPNVTYNANITSTTGVVNNTITESPIINSITSTRETGQEIAIGTFQTGALISFSNPAGLTSFASFVEIEIIRGDEQFNGINPSNVQSVRKETGNYTINGLITGVMYKIRARYADALGTVFGPWSDTQIFVASISGLTPTVPILEVDLDTTYIVAKVPQTVVKNADFKAYEYRLYKDTGVEDFWELVPNNTNNIKVIESQSEARFNLLDLPAPRISQAGITYRVACRAVSRTGEYSSQSALGTIVVTTIT